MIRFFWKIVEVDPKGDYKALFHGLPVKGQKRRSRRLETNKWIEAEIKEVTDGSSRPYTSGLHIMLSKEEAETFLKKRFKNTENKTVVPVLAEGVRKKEHSPHNIWLADRIYILG